MPALGQVVLLQQGHAALIWLPGVPFQTRVMPHPDETDPVLA